MNEYKIHLQGNYGTQKAIQSKDLKNNDVVIWNFNYKTKVSRILRETKTQVIVELEPINYDGKTHQRRLGKNRLIAVE